MGPISLLNTYATPGKRVFVVRPNSLLTTYSAPQGKRGAALRPNSLLNAYGMKGKRGLSLRPNRLVAYRKAVEVLIILMNKLPA